MSFKEERVGKCKTPRLFGTSLDVFSLYNRNRLRDFIYVGNVFLKEHSGCSVGNRVSTGDSLVRSVTRR